MHKSFKYRLYPTKSQVDAFNGQLSEACRLYNAAVQERRDAWRVSRRSLSFYTQNRQLKDIRANGDIGIANFAASCHVLRQVDEAFKAFFRRVKRKEKAGFPRFKSHTRFDSVTFPIYGNGCKLIDSKLRLQGVGLVKVKLHRAVEGTIKTVTIKRECGKWHACFSVEYEATPLPVSVESVGIDVGLTHFATLSDGMEIDNPRYYRNAQAALRIAQRKVSRRKKGSHRRRKAVRLLQRAYAHVRNQRADFHHKLSHGLVSKYGIIAVEDLNIKGLVRTMLAKSVNDAGWGQFLDKIAYKAENAGRDFFRVNPSGTTQNCSNCGERVPKTLSQRVHSCACGLELGRDHNAAINILRLGLSLKDITCPVAECVSLEAICFS